MSEYRLDREEPGSVMYEQLCATAYTAHPYQWSVLGWRSDIRSWEQKDLETFFDRNYAPNNATLVLVGDVDANDALALVKAKLGPIPRKPERRPLHTREPEQKGERRVTVRHPSATVSQFMAAWHMCATPDPDFAVFEILEYVLLDGESSRLYRLLVEEEGVCLSIYNYGGWQGHQFDPSLFVIDGDMREGVPTARAEELVYGALDEVAKDGLTDAELAKAKHRLKVSLLRRLKTIDGKAALLSETETFFGGWRNLPGRLARIEAVTSDDVRRVVKKTFTPENRTVCVLEVER
jgi:zinc protease